MSRSPLPEAITASRVIAVLRGLDPDRVLAVADVLRASGISVIEVTMDSPGATESIEKLAGKAFFVGAGTIMSVVEVEEAVRAGAAFVVAPHTDPGVVHFALERAIPMIPGAFTPTEIMAVWNLGVAAVKVFPASVGGPDLVRALAGPLGGIPLIPTGGITADNAAAFLAAGAAAVGMGGWLTNHADFAVIAERAAWTAEACRV